MYMYVSIDVSAIRRSGDCSSEAARKSCAHGPYHDNLCPPDTITRDVPFFTSPSLITHVSATNHVHDSNYPRVQGAQVLLNYLNDLTASAPFIKLGKSH